MQDEASGLHEDFLTQIILLQSEGSAPGIELTGFGYGARTIENGKWPTDWITYRGTDLPPPFHAGIRIKRLTSQQDASRADAIEAVRSINHLKSNIGRACDLMRDIVERAMKHVDGGNADLISWKPGQYQHTSAGLHIQCDLAVKHITQDMKRETTVFNITSTQDGIDCRHLSREMKAQKKRQSALNGIFRMDEVLAKALETMTPMSKRNLRNMITDRDHRAYTVNMMRQGDTWRQQDLKMFDITLPDMVETLRVKDDRMTGRIRLGPKTTWNRHTLRHHAQEVPETIVHGLAGKPVTALMDHQLLGGAMKIVNAKNSSDGYLLARCNPETVEYPQFGERA